MKKEFSHFTTNDVTDFVLKNTDLYSICYKWSFSPLGDQDKRRTDKLVKHGYTIVYNSLFKDIRDKEMNILEIGIETGGSLGLWSDYFYNSKVYGIDILENDHLGVPKKNFEEEGIFVEIADSTNRKEAKNVFKDTKFDIIIDDGSHLLKDQIATFENFYKKMSQNGMYIVEDFESKDDLIEFCKYANSEAVSKRTNTGFFFVDLSQFRGRDDDLMAIGTGPDHSLDDIVDKVTDLDKFKYSYLLDLYTINANTQTG